MMKNTKKNRTIRRLSLCLSLVTALGLLAAPAAAAVDYPERAEIGYYEGTTLDSQYFSKTI